MDKAPNPSGRPSYIPRPSKLPVPRSLSSTVPASSSKESSAGTRSVSSTRLRAIPSRDQLSSASAPRTARVQSRDPSPRSNQRPPKTSPEIRHDAILSGPVDYPTWQVQQQDQGSFLFGHSDSGTALHEAQACVDTELRPRKSRPSLSERVIETLAQLPPSPAVRRRESNFFNPESPMRPPSRNAGSRPGSSYNSDTSMRPPSRNTGSRPGSSHPSDTSMRPPSRGIGSRPGSSMGVKVDAIPIDFREAASAIRPLKTSNTPLKGSAAGQSVRIPAKARSSQDLRSSISTSRVPSDNLISPIKEQSPSVIKSSSRSANMKSGSMTVTGRSLRPRASVGALLRKPSMPEVRQAIVADDVGPALKKTAATVSNTSSEVISIVSKASKKSATGKSATIFESERQEVRPIKSSLALRDQIAKAKAAKRAQMAKKVSSTVETEAEDDIVIIPTATFDFGLASDPFNQQHSDGASKGLLRKRIDSARTDGKLNITGMGLKEIPSEVMDMYNLESISGHGGSWAESVDLTRFIAADNELASIGDDFFPDIDPRAFEDDDDDARGSQFAGLEILDLHGNVLQALPLGLRRLQLLTTLNLSNNKLGNDCFDIISQISSLKDLRLADNKLSGELDVRTTDLPHLEFLDVQQNQLISIPMGIEKLRRLRVFNVSRNEITSLPVDSLHSLPLTQLLAANNKLSGQLCSAQYLELPRLQILDVTGNSLTLLTSGQMQLPSLHQLSCSANRLTCLPDLSSWLSLLTLSANDNSISAIPEGFASLPQLKNVDFSGNDIRHLDDGIGCMETLDAFSISGNPLRERKFASMTTEDLKRTLRSRLAQGESTKDDTDTDTSFATATSSPNEPESTEWSVKAGGILDISSTDAYSLNPILAAQIASTESVRVLQLHHNIFKEIPSSIAFFAATLTTVNISHNMLTSDIFIADDLDLPALKELNLCSNTLTSVQPLIERLQAPHLLKLDISFNRLTSLPALRAYFPSLTTVLVSNNSIKELVPESIDGLQVVDCSSNDLSSLNARIGLLGGPNGLKRLEVRGNRFRVPNYAVLDKGTDALLAWLRSRIPASEIDSDS